MRLGILMIVVSMAQMPPTHLFGHTSVRLFSPYPVRLGMAWWASDCSCVGSMVGLQFFGVENSGGWRYIECVVQSRTTQQE